MPSYDHICEKCKHEWEDVYKMSDPIPSTCPACKEINCVKRLISYATPGKVELYGRELVEHLYAEGKKMAKNPSENTIADIVGPKYHENELKRSRR